jgi:hypothetical protein
VYVVLLLVGVLLLMADYYGGGFETRVQAIEYFQLQHGQWALCSLFILKKTMGLQ